MVIETKKRVIILNSCVWDNRDTGNERGGELDRGYRRNLRLWDRGITSTGGHGRGI